LICPEQFIPVWRQRHGIESLGLDEEATLYVPRLPKLHADPFDRMLICQAIIHGLPILTPDPQIAQ
jgi:PIN domain nuclease of toxin-antitoxin system